MTELPLGTIMFEYEKEAIHIKARRVDTATEEFRKFSVDPNITSFQVLQSILARAFELPGAEMSIRYLHREGGTEMWQPLLSDWDLDTAVLGSAEQDLMLQVSVLSGDPCCLGEVSTLTYADTKSPSSPFVPELPPVGRALSQATARGTETMQTAGHNIQDLVTKSTNQAEGFFKKHVAPSLPGLRHRLKAALNLEVGEGQGEVGEGTGEPQRQPVTDMEFRGFLNKVGQVVAPRELRLAVYRGGLEPGLRKIAWKHLLNLYPAGMSGGERLSLLKERSLTYQQLKGDWMALVLQGRISDDVKTVMNMVRKDVLRTDRQHPFFAGEGNPNVTSLFNILTTYALNHPSVSYCQGMSDLASPLLVTLGDESHAYLCFAALMQRMRPNFLLDGEAMTVKFQHLTLGLLHYDPEFYTYLKMQQADDLLFCYRWLLLEMKREFPFSAALRALEVSWASLPPPTPDTRVEMWEQRFSPVLPPSTSLELAKPCQTPYGTVRALRKQSLVRMNSEQEVSKGGQAGTQRGRVHSETGATGPQTPRRRKGAEKSQSQGSVASRRKERLERTQTDSIEEEGDKEQVGKKLTNLKEFYALTGGTGERLSGEEVKEEGTSASAEKKEADRDTDSRPEDSCKNTPESSVFVSPCAEASPSILSSSFPGSLGWRLPCARLPPPTELGAGNPFLIFLCLACLLQHRRHIMAARLDYQDIAMYFDRLVRGHNVERVLAQARKLFREYLNQDWSPSPQQQKENEHC